MTANDSEVKILEQIAKDLPSDAKGQISLYTEQQPCASCSWLDPNDPGVIQQFKNAYPGIELIITWSITTHPKRGPPC